MGINEEKREKMEYISTRGGASPIVSSKAMLLGLAEDGGLYTPQSLPMLTEGQRSIEANYSEIAARILALFLTDYDLRELREMTAKAYSCPRHFSVEEIVPLRFVGDGLSFLELWHGPTSAFKDLALQLLPYLLRSATQKQAEEREIILLVATSGDTGKAALEGFRDIEGTRVVVFYPVDGVSEIQKRQMITQEGENTCVIGVKGNFDQAQTGVKAIFLDQELAGKLFSHGKCFSSANSINWGRLAPQIAYYVWAWKSWGQRDDRLPEEGFNIVVPTGNFGNILAAYYAKKLGVPVKRLICASNRNNVLTEFIRTGVYDRKREFHQTMSPAMDILISSNLERLLYELTGREPSRIKALMTHLQEEGSYSLESREFQELQMNFWGGYASEEETLFAIHDCYQRHGYLIDPHTAVGYKVYHDYLSETGDHTPTVIASTASPYKFGSAVADAVMGGEKKTNRDEFRLLEELSGYTGVPIPTNLLNLEKKPIRHRRIIAPAEMRAAIETVLGL